MVQIKATAAQKATVPAVAEALVRRPVDPFDADQAALNPAIRAGLTVGTAVRLAKVADTAEATHDHAGEPDVDTILDRVEAHLPHVDPALAQRGRRAIAVARASRHLTREQMELTYDASGGFHTTAPVETELLDIGSDRDPNLRHVPFLGAQVVVNDYRPEAYGRNTEVWVHYGTSTGAVSPAKARQVAQEMREFAARLEVLCDVADVIAVDGFEAGA